MKAFILDCIETQRGDNLYRAQCAFRHCSPLEMDELYGKSGQTRQQIIDGYKVREEKCNAARELVQRYIPDD